MEDAPEAVWRVPAFYTARNQSRKWLLQRARKTRVQLPLDVWGQKGSRTRYLGWILGRSLRSRSKDHNELE